MDDKEEISHSDILDQVKQNTNAIRAIDGKLEQIRKENAPIRSFVTDFDTAARIGRGFRALIGWVVVVGGFIAMIYIVVADALR